MQDVRTRRKRSNEVEGEAERLQIVQDSEQANSSGLVPLWMMEVLI